LTTDGRLVLHDLSEEDPEGLSVPYPRAEEAVAEFASVA
jgi:hypothetical protein